MRHRSVWRERNRKCVFFMFVVFLCVFACFRVFSLRVHIISVALYLCCFFCVLRILR
jgi:hypothetical protein